MRKLALVLGICAAGAGAAHQGVQNPAVMAWMNGMTAIAAQTKVLGDMAKGKTAFDAGAAQTAAAALGAEAARIPALFAAEERDPKSEALDAIWQDLDDFNAKAQALQAAATADVSTPQALAAAMARIGAACQDCHRAYRE